MRRHDVLGDLPEVEGATPREKPVAAAAPEDAAPEADPAAEADEDSTVEEEPAEGASRETSQVLVKVFGALRDEGSTKADVAEQINILPEELDRLVIGLVLLSMDGGSSGPSPIAGRRPQLRVVK